MENNFLNKKECKNFIDFYKKNKASKFFNTFTLPLEPEEHKDLIQKLNSVTKKLNNSVVDYLQIVEWPAPNIGQQLHFDTGFLHTTLSSIIYLNDEFKGGHTCFEDKTSFSPVTGRAIFFDGQYFKHGVSSIKKNNRYTIATWFLKNV